jgi:hypothetical protein
MAQNWLLKRGDVLLGTLQNCAPDQPFFFCKFTPTEAFQEIKPLFDEELKLLNDQAMEEWEKAYAVIDALGLRLESPVGGVTIDQFLLHLNGEEAWFRY